MTAYLTGPVVTASLMVHLYPGVPLRVSLHPGEDRAVVAIGTGTLLLDLFCNRAELVTLRDTLAAAVADLDTARQALNDATGTDDTTDTDDSTGTAGTGGSAPTDEVRTPAAPDGRHARRDPGRSAHSANSSNTCRMRVAVPPCPKQEGKTPCTTRNASSAGGQGRVTRVMATGSTRTRIPVRGTGRSASSAMAPANAPPATEQHQHRPRQRFRTPRLRGKT